MIIEQFKSSGRWQEMVRSFTACAARIHHKPAILTKSTLIGLRFSRRSKNIWLCYNDIASTLPFSTQNKRNLFNYVNIFQHFIGGSYARYATIKSHKKISEYLFIFFSASTIVPSGFALAHANEPMVCRAYVIDCKPIIKLLRSVSAITLTFFIDFSVEKKIKKFSNREKVVIIGN